MKQNDTERKYLQLVKEPFCQIFQEIPFVSDIDFVPINASCRGGIISA